MSKYLAYFPESSPKSLQQFAGATPRSEKIPGIRLFLGHYKAYPCILKCPRADSNVLFHISSVLNYLKNEFGHDENNDLILRKYHEKAKQFFAT